jgi:hypothetical protein
MARNKRFIWQKAQGGIMKELTIIVDRETGINYLFAQYGYAGGLTPLLDKDGKPVVTPPSEIIDD